MTPRERLLAELRARQGLPIGLGGVRTRPRKRLPRQQQPDAQRRAYFALIVRQVLEPLKAAIAREVLPRLDGWIAQAKTAQVTHDTEGLAALYHYALRLDASGDETVDEVLDRVFDDLTARFDRAFGDKILAPQAYDVTRYQKEQFGRQVEATFGIRLERAEPWLGPKAEQWVRENVALIKTIPQELHADLAKRLTAGISAGWRHEELAQMIEDRYGVAESRAALIARDQVGKLFANVNEARQAGLGIKRYTWRTALDNRVREQHEHREGKVYSWSDPPVDDYFGPVNPGEAINCRCTAEPVLDDVFSDLLGEPEGEDVDLSDL